MTPDNHHDDPTIDRRTILKQGALAAGGLTLGAVGGAAADKPTRYSRDLTGLNRFSPCTGEVATVTRGTQHYLVHEHTDGNGGTHYTLQTHWKPKIRAVGQETGIVWTGQNTKALTRNFRAEGCPFTVTFLSTTTLTSKGSAPNLLFRIRQHVTVNANGEITNIRIPDSTIKCKG